MARGLVPPKVSRQQAVLEDDARIKLVALTKLFKYVMYVYVESGLLNSVSCPSQRGIQKTTLHCTSRY